MMQQHTQAQSPVDATLPMSFNVIKCHSLSSLTVTILSCSLQLPLLDLLSLSLSLSLPLPLDEPAEEDKELAPSDMFAKLSLQSTDTGSVLLSFLTPPSAGWITGARNFLAAHCGKKEQKGLNNRIHTHSVQIPAVTTDLQCK